MPSLAHRLLLVAVAVTLCLTGCASTRIVNQWRNADYASARFQKVLVFGVSAQQSIRRTFEDEFVARLGRRGVSAEPSYRYVPEEGRVDEARIKQAVTVAGADAAIITRLIRMETRTQFTPGYYAPPPAFTLGFYHGYSAAWFGYYEPPRMYQYEVYTSETSLYDIARNQLVWTGTAQTTEPGDLNTEIRRYVDTMVGALEDNHLL